MARLSKTAQFAIYQDGILTTNAAEQRSLDASTIEKEDNDVIEELEDLKIKIADNGTDGTILRAAQDHVPDENDADDERRQSSLTTASISSLPESSYETEHELEDRERNSSPPTAMRPSFRQIQSIQQQQVKSAPHFGSSTPRRSLLYPSRSKSGTPRSVRSYIARGSPRPRKRISEATDTPEEEQKHFPLVLLHVSLIPANLPWSIESMIELLPANVLENLQLIRSKVSETMLSRGILISHPKEEYELLEERLLEAVELKDERVTKCGHFHSRHSSSQSDIGTDSDSGIGSSLDDFNGEVCTTCENRIKTCRTAVGNGSKKWSVRIFAANGLMRASAWAVAWSDMESVDVEILPWINDDLRRKLDERREQEEAAAEAAAETERLEVDEKVRRIIEEQVWLAREDLKRHYEADRNMRRDDVTAETDDPPNLRKGAVNKELEQDVGYDLPRSTPWDVPPIYRPSQIPVSILLKNYMYLLAQDRRNVMVFLLSIVAIVLMLVAAARPKHSPPSWRNDAGAQILEQIALPTSVQDKMTQVVRRSDNAASSGIPLRLRNLNSSSKIRAAGETADIPDDVCVYDRYKWYIDDPLKGVSCPAWIAKSA